MINAEKLLSVVKTALEDAKAKEISVFNVRSLTTVTDFMVIASGTSNRQVISIAQRVIEQAKLQGYRPLGEEGGKIGEWVLVDLGDVIVHVMQPQIRDFYQLEKLWG